MSYALVVGEALVDVVHASDGTVREHPGGSAANVAVALARLERPVRLATAYADDAYGRLIAAHLAADGVAAGSDPAVVARTSSATATLQADGSARYAFDLDWRLGEVPLAPAPVVVHACSLGAVVAPGRDQVLDVLARARSLCPVAYDVNARPAVTGTGADTVAAVERVVALADVVKASDEDLEALWPALGVDAAAERLLTLGPHAVVVTRGGEGATWFRAEGRVDVRSRPVTVADTIGAGDTFGAALLDGLWDAGLLGAPWATTPELDDARIEALLAHAARAAAVTVSRPGADPPHRREL
ncbi:PfkB family carbohydrate kinase [Nocardioides sp. TRM66260-LWL]|uniref:PfkB family carbohydrate kinase n=1 Tax=Nocardioides sp. TRM66260-LWL TaxID=2874478 RepID=UPI001CC4E1FE|nr:PfkB family carbohydrate kinase [Nocardioides sp. TRM66260-LWL]MBZ5734495.1 PfkB family carbohydrate kinase [Nocardioides sp. TRM66260-LWL]